MAKNIGPCEGAYGVAKVFYLDGVRLHLPDAVTDKQLRYLVDRGMPISDAYGQVGWFDELPPVGMRECCYGILRQKWMDQNRELQISGWGHTCAGYFGCLEKYVLALRETNKIGRMKLAEGLYVPSPAEEACIKRRFAQHLDIARAYSECNALDILPGFPGAVESMNMILAKSMAERTNLPLYKVIQTLFNLAPLPGEPDHGPHDGPTASDELSSFPYMAAGVAVLLVIVLSRR